MKLLCLTTCLLILGLTSGCLNTDAQEEVEPFAIDSANEAPVDLTPGPVEGELLPSSMVLAKGIPTPQLFKLDQSLSHMYFLPDQQRVLDIVLIGPGSLLQTRSFYEREMKAAGWILDHQHQKGEELDMEFETAREMCRLEMTKRTYNQDSYTVVKMLVMPRGSQRKDP